MTVNDLYTGFHIGMHACGEMHGRRGTNCKEAFYAWYEKGVRFFEVDIAATVDGEFVAIAHGLTPKFLNKYQITDCKEENTSDWFLKQKLFPVSIGGGLTPMSLSDVLLLVKVHSDIVVMLDPCLMKLIDFQSMLSKVYDLSRAYGISTENKILIETYTPEMQSTLVNSSLQCEGIYCVHDSRYDFDEKIVDKLQDMNLHFVSYPWSVAVNEVELLKSIVQKGINVLSVFRDNLEAKKMKELGIRINLVSYYYSSFIETAIKLPINYALRKFGYLYYKYKTGKECY